jgi:hypothetical protein
MNELIRHNEELYDLYFSPNIIRVIKSRRMRWTEHVARIGTGKVPTGFWWGDLRERDHLEHKRRWEDNIKMDLQEVGWGGMECIYVAQDEERWQAFVNAVMNLRVP